MEMATVPPIQTDDEQLIDQTLSGLSDAFGVLIQKYQVPLFDLAYRILGSRGDAEDVLQDAFLKAYKHLREFNRQSRFSTWLYSILLNGIRNRLRHEKVIRWSSLDAPREPQENDKAPELPDRGPSIQRLTDSQFELESIQNEVQLLPLDYQTIFILHYFQDLPLQEIATRLKRPVGTVKVYLHRARKLLYKRLAAKTSIGATI